MFGWLVWYGGGTIIWYSIRMMVVVPYHTATVLLERFTLQLATIMLVPSYAYLPYVSYVHSHTVPSSDGQTPARRRTTDPHSFSLTTDRQTRALGILTAAMRRRGHPRGMTPAVCATQQRHQRLRPLLLFAHRCCCVDSGEILLQPWVSPSPACGSAW